MYDKRKDPHMNMLLSNLSWKMGEGLTTETLLEQLYMQARSKQWWYGHVTMGMEYHHSCSVGYMQPAFCVAVCELLSTFKNYRIPPKCGTATVVPAMQVAMGLR